MTFNPVKSILKLIFNKKTLKNPNKRALMVKKLKRFNKKTKMKVSSLAMSFKRVQYQQFKNLSRQTKMKKVKMNISNHILM
jgi:hypothetical protein